MENICSISSGLISNRGEFNNDIAHIVYGLYIVDISESHLKNN